MWQSLHIFTKLMKVAAWRMLVAPSDVSHPLRGSFQQKIFLKGWIIIYSCQILDIQGARSLTPLHLGVLTDTHMRNGKCVTFISAPIDGVKCKWSLVSQSHLAPPSTNTVKILLVLLYLLFIRASLQTEVKNTVAIQRKAKSHFFLFRSPTTGWHQHAHLQKYFVEFFITAVSNLSVQVNLTSGELPLS